MNLYVYFASPSLNTYHLPSSSLNKATYFILKIKDSPLSLKKQELLISKFVQALHHNSEESQAFSQSRAAFQATLEKQKQESSPVERWAANHPKLVENLDILLFIPLWIGIYQGLFCEILEHHNLFITMSFGFSNLFQALGGYIAIKLTLATMLYLKTGWKRWLSFIGLFISYLFWMKLSSYILGTVYIQAINVILISVLIFLAALTLIVQIFGKPLQN